MVLCVSNLEIRFKMIDGNVKVPSEQVLEDKST